MDDGGSAGRRVEGRGGEHVGKAEQVGAGEPQPVVGATGGEIGDRVVAVSSYDEYPPEVKTLPRVGALLDPDVERIIALRPDLVLLYGSQTDLMTQLQRAAIAYYEYRHGDLGTVTATIRALGARTGRANAAESLAATIERRLAESVEIALRLANDIVVINTLDGGDRLFSRRLACTYCGVSMPEMTPRAFSFNSPHGACPDCQGLG